MDHHRHMAVAMIKGLSHVGVVVFQFPGKSLCQAIHTGWMDHSVVRRSELGPLQRSGILTVLKKLSLRSNRNKQKQNEDHPAFVVQLI